MFAQLRSKSLWWAVGLVLLLPALGGGYSMMLGWPQAILIFALIFALQLTDRDALRRLPWWFFALGAGLAVLGVVWLWPGDTLLFLSPTRAEWPGPDGTVSGIAADRVSTRESLILALGFWTVLGISLILSDRPERRRWLTRAMLLCCSAVIFVALLIHYLRMPVNLLPDVPVLYWNRLSYPFTGANLAAAFFVSALPFGVGSGLLFSDEERYLPRRRVWLLAGVVACLMLLALQLMTQNRWMWAAAAPVIAAAVAYLLSRRMASEKRLKIVLGTLGVVLLAGIYLSLFDPGKLMNRFVLLIHSDNEENSRSLVWQNACNTIQEYPCVGVGLGGFGEVCPTTAPAGIHKWPRYAHSEPLEFLAETGIAGALLLCAVIIGIVQSLRKLQREKTAWSERMPFIAAALLLGLASCVDFPLRCPALLFLFAFYLGTALGADRPAAAGNAPKGPRWSLPGLALTAVVLVCAGWVMVEAQQLFQRGQAFARFEAERRDFARSKDTVALSAAAQSLFEACNGQTRWSAEALNTIINTAPTPDAIDGWAPAVDAVLAQSPYHDSLYYFRARVALNAGDLEQAAHWNKIARRCAATNRDTLRKIVGLDWYLAVSTADPVKRADRLAHAQDSLRWALSGDPDALALIIDGFPQLQIPIDDVLPGIPADWTHPDALCQLGSIDDRPLTVLQAIQIHDIYTAADREMLANTGHTALASRWDLDMLTCTGQADAATQMIVRRYAAVPQASRPQVLSEARSMAWGVLSAEQWQTVAQAVENSLPAPLEQYQLGLLYLQMNETSRARQTWLASFKNRRTPQVARALALFYWNANAKPFAGDYAFEWTQLAPKDPAAWRMLALTAAGNNNFTAALHAFKQYQALDPAHAEADFTLHSTILSGAKNAGAGNRPEEPTQHR